MNAHTLIIGGISVLFFVTCTVLSYIFNFPPFLTSLSAGIVFALVLHYLLEGAKGSVLALPWVRLTGSAAIVGTFLIWGTEPISKWQSVIEPDPQTWIALDDNGSYVPITIKDTTYSKNVTSFFKDTTWDVKKDSGLVILSKNDEDMGTINLRSVSEIGFFDSIEMHQGRNIQYSDELSSGDESELFPYPFTIRATTFRDEYNGFQILGADGGVLIEGALQTRNFEFFRHHEEHYLVFVVRARHNDPARPPWAVFGLTRIQLVIQSID